MQRARTARRELGSTDRRAITTSDDGRRSGRRWRLTLAGLVAFVAFLPGSVPALADTASRIARAVSHRLGRRSEIDTPGRSSERLLARADSDPLAGNRSAPEALLATRASVR
jgi:hypothetical protein